MKLVTFIPKQHIGKTASPFQIVKECRYGWLEHERVWDCVLAEAWCVEQGLLESAMLPSSLLSCIEMEDEGLQRMERIKSLVEENETDSYRLQEIQLMSPLPLPRSIRDFYAFEQHVKAARAKRGLEMVPEWYHFPVFYFSNHHAVTGHDVPVKKPAMTDALDFELEIAAVIGKAGINISPDNALQHIVGFMIMNDWSARDLQREEVKVGLGPAKGKDFATSFGPYLVTPDELSDVLQDGRHDLTMTARVNGIEYSRGNTKDIYWTFADMVARASQDCWLYPGEVIGSGTVGTGCILEWGSERFPWLKPGDVVELSIDRLGVLRNIITE